MSLTKPVENGCVCSAPTGAAQCSGAGQPRPVGQMSRLEDLIPIAIVVAGGCEKCAQRMVTRALNNGASPRDIRKALAIVALFQRQDCFAEEVGPEVIARMSGPLLMGKRTLEALARAKK